MKVLSQVGQQCLLYHFLEADFMGGVSEYVGFGEGDEMLMVAAL